MCPTLIHKFKILESSLNNNIIILIMNDKKYKVEISIIYLKGFKMRVIITYFKN